MGQETKYMYGTLPKIVLSAFVDGVVDGVRVYIFVILVT